MRHVYRYACVCMRVHAFFYVRQVMVQMVKSVFYDNHSKYVYCIRLHYGSVRLGSQFGAVLCCVVCIFRAYTLKYVAEAAAVATNECVVHSMHCTLEVHWFRIVVGAVTILHILPPFRWDGDFVCTLRMLAFGRWKMCVSNSTFTVRAHSLSPSQSERTHSNKPSMSCVYAECVCCHLPYYFPYAFPFSPLSKLTNSFPIVIAYSAWCRV